MQLITLIIIIAIIRIALKSNSGKKNKYRERNADFYADMFSQTRARQEQNKQERTYETTRNHTTSDYIPREKIVRAVEEIKREVNAPSNTYNAYNEQQQPERKSYKPINLDEQYTPEPPHQHEQEPLPYEMKSYEPVDLDAIYQPDYASAPTIDISPNPIETKDYGTETRKDEFFKEYGIEDLKIGI